MCGCEKHQKRRALCTCICPEHRNFDQAYDLAMMRYDEIVALRAEVEALCATIRALDDTTEKEADRG